MKEYIKYIEEYREDLRNNFNLFLTRAFTSLRPGESYKPNWHIDVISEYLMACKKGQIKRLILNMPPRMMKSLCVSVAYPAWLMGNDPTTNIICASYAQTLSNQHSLDCRSLIESDWFRGAFPKCKLAKDQNEKSKYMTTERGMRFATSVGGTVTGAGGSCFPSGTMIDTDQGMIDIEEFYDCHTNAKVKSFNHKTGNIEYKPVVASKMSIVNGLYEIQTARGNVFRVTGDHKIYVRNKGYIAVINLVVGDGLYNSKCSDHIRYSWAKERIDKAFGPSKLGIFCKKIYNKIRDMFVDPPYSLGDYIISVKIVSNSKHNVYDIQVEDNKNFFAENILVHNCIIVDDPLNPSQAASDAERNTANEWMSSTIPSRLNNQQEGVIIVVMQRLHEEDVTGYLLDKGGWEHLCLPVKNDRERIISIGDFKKIFKQDELLHPERMPQKVIDNLEVELGSFEFASQFMQLPVPKGGGILRAKWWKEWEQKSLPSCEYILQVYDTAFKTGNMNDYSARTTWGIFRHTNHQPNIILLEAMNKRLTLPELREEALESYYDFDPDMVLIEDKASGISLIQELRRLGIRLKTMPRNKGDDKVSRAHVASVMLEQGVVWYPKNQAWASEVIRQCASFPNAKHDDLVDTVSDALIFLRQYKRIETPNDNLASSGTQSFKPTYSGHYT